MIVWVTDEVKAGLDLPVTGPRDTWGGFQRLCWEIQQQIGARTHSGWPVLLDYRQGLRLVRYTEPKYGSGGYQARLLPLREQVVHALKTEPKPQLGLFDEEVEDDDGGLSPWK